MSASTTDVAAAPAGARPALHSAMTIVDPATVTATRWKNGLGTTRELVRLPDPLGTAADFALRVAVADLEADSDFSSYPGINRLLTKFSGSSFAIVSPGSGSGSAAGGDNDDKSEGASNRGAAAPATPVVDLLMRKPMFDTAFFSGEQPLACRMFEGGHARDLNIMFQRGLLAMRACAIVATNDDPKPSDPPGHFTIWTVPADELAVARPPSCAHLRFARSGVLSKPCGIEMNARGLALVCVAPRVAVSGSGSGGGCDGTLTAGLRVEMVDERPEGGGGGPIASAVVPCGCVALLRAPDGVPMTVVNVVPVGAQHGISALVVNFDAIAASPSKS